MNRRHGNDPAINNGNSKLASNNVASFTSTNKNNDNNNNNEAANGVHVANNNPQTSFSSNRRSRKSIITNSSNSKKTRYPFRYYERLIFAVMILVIISFILMVFSVFSLHQSENKSSNVSVLDPLSKDRLTQETGDINIPANVPAKSNIPVLKTFFQSHEYTREEWNARPFRPPDTTASALQVKNYPNVNQQCSKLLENLPINSNVFPGILDPFLPWIHDVFPTADGSQLQFVAQNFRRCNSGKTYFKEKLWFEPQASLFQHVPVRRSEKDGETRYYLTNHTAADPDGIATRFICVFPSGEETLSTFNVDYDYHTWRKGYHATFTEEGYDNHIIWNSQLLFSCPVPLSLQNTIRNGEHVINDVSNLHMTLVPIRTPPRFGYPISFMQPRFEPKSPASFIPEKEWGETHLIPKVKDSGRWENLPICLPPRLQHPAIAEAESTTNSNNMVAKPITNNSKKQYDLIMCTWAASSFKTRGDDAKISDGKRRLFEWLTFHLLSGVDHIYIYDNTGAFVNTTDGTPEGMSQEEFNDLSLKSITDQFPASEVTHIYWPCKICNNNRHGHKGDNHGERSSQYAAESSCRLRYGPHSEWMGFIDTDEYLVPTGKYENMKDVLNDLDKKTNILRFRSNRARPRFDLLEIPENLGPQKEFDIVAKADKTIMQTYNCDDEPKPPKLEGVPQPKELYRSDYVLLHYLHYSTITVHSAMSKSEINAAGLHWRQMYKEATLVNSDEAEQAFMLHSKSRVKRNTKDWHKQCRNLRYKQGCWLGFPFPKGVLSEEGLTQKDKLEERGFVYNCYASEKIDDFWIPRLEEAMTRRKVTTKGFVT
mmetsp:Transcript_2659/g.3081  ORF Transcript_2659/g.3081 Transcript_2659/m.3081 type:complete len:825 (-) Transcript_2659:150-2624(-)